MNRRQRSEIFHRQFFGRLAGEGNGLPGGNEAFAENCWSHLPELQRVIDADHIWWQSPIQPGDVQSVEQVQGSRRPAICGRAWIPDVAAATQVWILCAGPMGRPWADGPVEAGRDSGSGADT